MTTRPIYFDNQATTRVDPRVLEAMLPYYQEEYGNPHSDGHAYGWDASEALASARADVASLIGTDAREIIFTSGATEACNLAIQGVARAARGERRKIVTLATEHACVLEACGALAGGKYEVTVLPVQADGLVDLGVVEKAVDERVLLVSAMAANNEIGVLQPLRDIAAICHKRGAYLHSDAAQAAGKIPVDVRAWDVDLLSLSAHKMYGPKGIGALYLRWGPTVNIEPLQLGGGQERGLRPGTVPVPLAVGLGEACQLALEGQDEEAARIRQLTTLLRDELLQRCPNAVLRGHPQRRLPGNLSISFAGQSGDEIVAAVSDKIAISTGSACSSSSLEPSHVLTGLGLTPEEAQSTVRISVGRFNTEEEVKTAIETLTNTTRSLGR